MRVCIPTVGERGLEEKVVEHFNNAPTYTIVDTEKNSTEILRNPGKDWCPLKAMEEKDFDVVVCSHLGHSVLPVLEELGILVYVGAYGKVKDAIRMWKGDMLYQATNA